MPWLRRRYETRSEPAWRRGRGRDGQGRRPGVGRAVGRALRLPAGAGAHDLVVIDRTGDGEHHAPHSIRGPPVLDDRTVRRSAHRTDGARDLAAEGMTRVEHLVEEREDVVGRRVDVHPDLVDDDRLLGGVVAATQERPQGQLADRLEGDTDVLGRHLGAVDGELSIGARVHAAADALDQLRQESRIGMRPGSLEDEMLEEVAEAGVSVILVPRADRHEQHDARRSRAGQRLGDDPKAAALDGPLVRDDGAQRCGRRGRGHAGSSSSSARSPSAASASADINSSIWMNRRSRASSPAFRGSGRPSLAAIGLGDLGQALRAARRELEHDPLVADDERVDEELIAARVELEVLERVEIEADGERREVRGDLGMVDHDPLDPSGPARLDPARRGGRCS